MLQLSGMIVGKPVLSLRTGRPVAVITQPIINPNNLKIEGFYVLDNRDKSELILLVQDIREIISKGFVVNDHGVLAEAEDLVRLKDILALNFVLDGKPVDTTGGKRIGKLIDYAVDGSSMYIQKLYVGQSLLKSFTGGQLSVDRSQIHEITMKRIIINDPLEKGAVPVAAAA